MSNMKTHLSSRRAVLHKATCRQVGFVRLTLLPGEVTCAKCRRGIWFEIRKAVIEALEDEGGRGGSGMAPPDGTAEPTLLSDGDKGGRGGGCG